METSGCYAGCFPVLRKAVFRSAKDGLCWVVFKVMRLCGYAVMWLWGYVVMRLCGYEVMWFYGYEVMGLVYILHNLITLQKSTNRKVKDRVS